MDKIGEQFVCKEEKKFRFKIGRILASGLSGFIAGVIFATIALVLYVLWLRTAGC